MTSTGALAEFAVGVSYDGLPEEVREAAKRRVLDAVAVAIDSVGTSPTDGIRRTVATQNATGRCRLWGSELSAAASDAAMYNGALACAGNGTVFLAPALGSASIPVAAVLTAAEARSATGEELLAGVAAAHEIHGELAWHAPLDGFHPATHGAIAAAAGVGRALGFGTGRLESAIGIAAGRGTLAVDDEFDPVVGGNATHGAVSACLLAESGVVGPDAIAGPGGWHDLVGPFDLDLDPGCERVRDAAIRPYDAHPHAQSTLEAAMDLASDVTLDPADIDSVTVETYPEAVEALDPVTLAAALVDRDATKRPAAREDLRPVASTVEARIDDELRERAERGELPARVTVDCHDGATHEAEEKWFTGHPARAASWGVVEEKFHALAGDRYDVERRSDIVETVRGLEAETAAELTRLLD
ncbi:MmgE/PrpD family protein [Natronomonas gomsonensis]|jgi:2-methylcitrate dehydratase|uniref:MmgE/PrpD family protein n=1 Tax=Natronomonas gomsonensis TaxID=1046043 RepID=UPI0020CA7A4D|nr:MmgE/PrpD family protein [Natronomonas gomsonensis]MCY4731852.1 MmgE/PrpD family protein [Natronomonas gomsonensis]